MESVGRVSVELCESCMTYAGAPGELCRACLLANELAVERATRLKEKQRFDGLRADLIHLVAGIEEAVYAHLWSDDRLYEAVAERTELPEAGEIGKLHEENERYSAALQAIASAPLSEFADDESLLRSWAQRRARAALRGSVPEFDSADPILLDAARDRVEELRAELRDEIEARLELADELASSRAEIRHCRTAIDKTTDNNKGDI